MADAYEGSGTLGKVSLGLGIASSGLVFGIGICALTGFQGGWIGPLATLLYICGASSAFLGFLGFLTGVGGVLTSKKSRIVALIGTALSGLGICLFLGFLSAISG
jgi:hypothetical protein